MGDTRIGEDRDGRKEAIEMKRIEEENRALRIA